MNGKATPANAAEGGSDRRGAGLKVLVADDDDGTRAVIGRVLEARGHSVQGAEDGQEAWEFYQSQAFDLVVCDIKMPRMDGLELLARIRSVSAHAEVVLITGFADTSVVIEALRLGASNFLEKPFRMKDLARQLEVSFIRCGLAAQASRLQEELDAERRRRELERRTVTMGRLLAGLAHEVHNPLTFIKGNAELLETLVGRLLDRAGSTADPAHAQLGEEIHGLLSDLTFGARRVQELVDNMRLFGVRPESGEKTPTALIDVMENTRRLAEGRRGPTVELDFRRPPASLTVEAHRVEIETCLVNLLVNAYDAVSPSGGKVVFCATVLPFRTAAFEGLVEVSIVDNGPGVPERKIEDLFSPFVSHKAGRMGLGLSIAYEAARRSGAQIELHNEKGGGMRAVVRMPYLSEGTNASQEPGSAAEGAVA